MHLVPSKLGQERVFFRFQLPVMFQQAFHPAGNLLRRSLDQPGHPGQLFFLVIYIAQGSFAGDRFHAAQTGAVPGVLAVAPFVEGRGMLVNGQRSAGVELRGVSPAEESRVSSLGRLVAGGSLGDLEPGAYRIILGRALAEELGAAPGDRLLLVAPLTENPAASETRANPGM